MALTSGRLYRQLLDGWDTTTTTSIARATALDTVLATPGTLGAFKVLLGYPTACAQLMIDGLARETILYSSTALAAWLNHAAAAAALFANDDAQSQLESLVNSGSSYLTRTVYTSGSGNYTVHANGVKALYALILAGGGSGGGSTTNNTGHGGSGGELVGYKYPVTSLPAANATIAYSVGAAATASSFGSQTAAAGVTGGSLFNSDVATVAAGSTVNGGASANISNATLSSSAWHVDAFRQASGTGGSRNANGGAGYGGSGGTAGASGQAATAGTGLGSGGGGGFGSGSATTNGLSASANTGGGAGGANRTSSGTANGGTGGNGLIYVYAVKGRAA